MARITWTETGLSDLRTHTEFIRKESPKNAAMVNRRIREATRLLKKLPELGSIVPEFDDSTVRELVVYSYRIIYEVRDDECYILFVFHGSRDLKRYFGLQNDPNEDA